MNNRPQAAHCWQHSLPNHAIKPPVPRLVACKATPQSCLKSKLHILALGRPRLHYSTHALRHSSTQAPRHPGTWHSSTQALGHSIPQPSSTQDSGTQALGHSNTRAHRHPAYHTRRSKPILILPLLFKYFTHTPLLLPFGFCTVSAPSAEADPRPPPLKFDTIHDPSAEKPILACHHLLKYF